MRDPSGKGFSGEGPSIRTVSVLIQSLCVPCRNRCRHCLLSWDGRTEGSGWERSVRLAERFLGEFRKELPGIEASFAFGYAMEHPHLADALRTLRRLGSPMAGFLQCDGMAMRDAEECARLMELLCGEGIRQLNFTLYGLEEYHDQFAQRRGDFALLLRMMRAAGEAGLPFTTGIMLTKENLSGADALTDLLLEAGSARVALILPHGEGRGEALEAVRVTCGDLARLSPQTRALLNERLYRPESAWIGEPGPETEWKRQILISLRQENIEEYEGRSALNVLREIEALDENYYAAFPSFAELAGMYGDPKGERLYRLRDLYAHYRRLYAREQGLKIYDVTDERLSGSRRFG